jgi:flagellar motor switch/type III secretory pathway protein FliN
MTTNERMTHTQIEVSAVLSRVRMPVETLAALAPGDCLEVEPEISVGAQVRLTIGDKTIAIASVTEDNGCLIATIVRLGAGHAVEKPDPWQFRKDAPVSN